MACFRNNKNEPFYGNMEWVEANGRGKVFVFYIHHIALDSAFKDDISYVYELIRLEEGPIIESNELAAGWMKSM